LDKDTNVDYTMKNQVIFNSPRSHCEELNDEAFQLRFLTMFGMTLRVRLLRGVYTEFNEVLAMTTWECHCEGVKRPKQSNTICHFERSEKSLL